MRKRYIVLSVMIILALAAAAAVSADMVIAGEKPSPRNRMSLENIYLTENSVELLLRGARLSIVSGTNSMDPVLDEGSVIIELPPDGKSDILEGDIVTYYKDGKVIVHRVTELGTDESGWYAVTKGDNNPLDDGKIRWENIRGVVVGIVY